MIESYASLKSFVPRDSNQRDGDESNGFKPRNAELDFHGKKRCNDTHQSTAASC
jgi:hypothetical protein